ncbi:MAG TPA: hypothetical protein DEP35_21555 [Deltaproteobacteria bacterium]|nr:hypothetical protein [Deltaproteobacteria bacterium]
MNPKRAGSGAFARPGEGPIALLTPDRSPTPRRCVRVLALCGQEALAGARATVSVRRVGATEDLCGSALGRDEPLRPKR